MFDFALTEEHELLVKTAREFAVERLRPGMREREREGAVEAAVAGEYRELGFDRLELSADVGGSGLDAFAKALVLEQLAGGDVGAVVACEGRALAAYPLVEMGAEEELGALFERDDARAWIVVDDEGVLEVDGDWIRGTWPWIPAARLDVLVVLRESKAYVLRDGTSCSAVKPCALRAAGSSEISIDATAERVLDDARGAVRARARLRLHAASLLVGVATAAFEYAKAYALERVAFGRPVAHHQGVAFLIAELATKIDAARLSTWRAAWALGRDGDPGPAAASAMLDAADVALACGEQGVQLLGGHGYMQDHPAEKWMREARTLAQLWGGRDAALDVLAGSVLEAPGGVGLDPPAWETTQ